MGIVVARCGVIKEFAEVDPTGDDFLCKELPMWTWPSIATIEHSK